MSLYRTSEVDRLEREVVTEAMVDLALYQNYNKGGGRITRDAWMQRPGQRAQSRRNIAIGINAGTYSVAMFEALWQLHIAKMRVRELVTA